MLIGIDADEVLVDFVGAVNHEFILNGQPRFHPSGRWDIYKEFTHHQRDVFDGLRYSPSFSRSIEPFAYAQALASQLRKLGQLVCITAPFQGHTSWHKDRVRILKGLGFQESEIIFCHGDLKARFGCDILIEDKVSTLVAWQRVNPTGLGICLKTKYNYAELDPIRELCNTFVADTPNDIVRIAKKEADVY